MTREGSERIRADRAALILGVERRTVQALASRGELPDADTPDPAHKTLPMIDAALAKAVSHD